MQLNQFTYFIALEKYGSFSKAAEAVGISQPALTLQIQKLEEELGYRLLDRSRKPFQVTREGEAFLERALDIVQRVDELKDLSIEMSEEIAGHLRVGIIPTVAPYLVPLFIDDLQKKYPQLHLEIQELKTEEIVEELKRGNIDCGILTTPIQAGSVIKRALFYERFYLYVSEGHELFQKDEIDLNDVDFSQLWYLQEGNCFQNQVNSICQLSGQTDGTEHLVYKSNSIESLRRIVESKRGITFIPELATIDIPVELEDWVKDIAGIPPLREVSLVLTRSQAKERQVEALTTILLNNIPGRMKKKPEGLIIDTDI
ncbi:hydrogen peroxide-inducible genes activator [Prolixibacteraceae bacterium JC049]|nr:hydrogen peroxide-inducible genes activator [Prolixibacteraceae bacterium JC049]